MTQLLLTAGNVLLVAAIVGCGFAAGWRILNAVVDFFSDLRFKR